VCCATLAWAVPQNNSIQQQSSWNGWGGLVDWSFRSLRLGSLLEDSLLDDGWLLADSAMITYLEADSIFGVHIPDTLLFETPVAADTLKDLTGEAAADSVLDILQGFGTMFSGSSQFTNALWAPVRVASGDTVSVLLRHMALSTL